MSKQKFIDQPELYYKNKEASIHVWVDKDGNEFYEEWITYEDSYGQMVIEAPNHEEYDQDENGYYLLGTGRFIGHYKS
ncbi:MAG TPA: hypothetical protein VLG50_06585 [Candidatus Saccharimonadales bacterium]|nr:hypothetical protein [Candidatus Saccharimonadales bacterium]